MHEVDHRANEIVKAMIARFQASQHFHAAQAIASVTRSAAGVAGVDDQKSVHRSAPQQASSQAESQHPKSQPPRLQKSNARA